MKINQLYPNDDSEDNLLKQVFLSKTTFNNKNFTVDLYLTNKLINIIESEKTNTNKKIIININKQLVEIKSINKNDSFVTLLIPLFDNELDNKLIISINNKTLLIGTFYTKTIELTPHKFGLGYCDKSNWLKNVEKADNTEWVGHIHGWTNRA